MNVYEKLQKIKLELLKCGLKKSGENKFAGFKYYELSDFLPYIIELCDKHKACTFFDFGKETATLNFIDTEAENVIVPVSSPLERLEIKGSNAIQALGGVQTYIRRYLYMAMFDITENDQFDATTGKKDEPKNIYVLIASRNSSRLQAKKTNIITPGKFIIWQKANRRTKRLGAKNAEKN